MFELICRYPHTQMEYMGENNTCTSKNGFGIKTVIAKVVGMHVHLLGWARELLEVSFVRDHEASNVEEILDHLTLDVHIQL